MNTRNHCPLLLGLSLCVWALVASPTPSRATETSVAPGADDPRACIAKGLAPEWRRAGSDSARQMVRNCLLSSQITPGLCDNVPAPGVNDVMGIEAWYLRGCHGPNLTSYHCQLLMDEVAEFCHAHSSG